MANGSVGMSGHSFDAFVSSQRTFTDYDFAAKIQEKYWRARQKFLAKVEKKEDSCIVLSDSKLDSKLEIYHSIDKSCARLTNILERYQNCLYVYANEENSLGILLKECSKVDKTKAGKVMAYTSRSLSQASHQRIRLYMPLLRLYQEMETFHSRAVNDTAKTVSKLEERRSQYRASLLWMKDISEKLDPDVYRKLDKFRRVQNQVRNDKKAFDGLQMDVVQKIDLLMASRCNLMNQILASYQEILLETFERNTNNFRSIEALIKKEDIYEYEFKTLKHLNPLKIEDEPQCPSPVDTSTPKDLAQPTSKDDSNDDLMIQDSATTSDADLLGIFDAGEKTATDQAIKASAELADEVSSDELDIFKQLSTKGDGDQQPTSSASVSSTKTPTALDDLMQISTPNNLLKPTHENNNSSNFKLIGDLMKRGEIQDDDLKTLDQLNLLFRGEVQPGSSVEEEDLPKSCAQESIKGETGDLMQISNDDSNNNNNNNNNDGNLIDIPLGNDNNKIYNNNFNVDNGNDDVMSQLEALFGKGQPGV